MKRLVITVLLAGFGTGGLRATKDETIELSPIRKIRQTPRTIRKKIVRFTAKMEEFAKTGDLSAGGKIERVGKEEKEFINKTITSKKKRTSMQKTTDNKVLYYKALLNYNALEHAHQKLLEDAKNFVRGDGPFPKPTLSSMEAIDQLKPVEAGLKENTNPLYITKLEKLILKTRTVLPAYLHLEYAVNEAQKEENKSLQILEIVSALDELEEARKRKKEKKIDVNALMEQQRQRKKIYETGEFPVKEKEEIPLFF